jgi:NADH-quinone oxidoreductase subunit J
VVALVGFVLLAVLAVVGALGVVFNRSPLYSALSLVGVFATTAGIYLMLSSPFLAVLQILVYAGAIMVLFIFVVMLLSLRRDEGGEMAGIPRGLKRWTAIGLAGLLVVLLGVLTTSFVLTGQPGPGGEAIGSVETIGTVLYRKYMYPFEVASVLLLVAIVGAVAVTRRHGRGLEGHVGEEEGS